MDVKACDVCKKTNIDTELFAFREFRMGDPQNPGAMPAPDAAIIGFAMRQFRPRCISSQEYFEMPDQLVCKSCGEKKILADLAIL